MNFDFVRAYRSYKTNLFNEIFINARMQTVF